MPAIGTWCAYKQEWTSKYKKITYDTLLNANSNLAEDALNIVNGESKMFIKMFLNLFFYEGGFSAPQDGVYMISFSYLALNSAGDSTYANVHVNNKRFEETINAAYFTSGGSGQVASTGARSLYLELDTGDTVTIWATTIDKTVKLSILFFCVQYVYKRVSND